MDKLDKAILLAPCIFTTTLGFENYEGTYPVYREQMNNVVNDPNWQYDVQSICSDPDNAIACENAKSYPAGEQMTTKSLELFDQIAITGRFQEYNPDFATAIDKTAPLVEPGLDSIDQVPLQFIMAADDMVCTTAQATDLMN